MSHAPKIAACLIVKDGVGTLETCLASLRPHVDEVNIYDTGSTDGTLELLERLGKRRRAKVDGKLVSLAPIRIERGEWRGDFAWARQQSFAMASEDVSWFVWADADDEVVGGAELRRLAASAPPNLATFVCVYETALDANGHAQAQVWRERLVRVGAGFEWRGVVHEYLAPPAGTKRKARLVDSGQLRWIHREPPGRRAQERNITMLLGEMERQQAAGLPVDKHIHRYLGLEHLWHGSFAAAVPYLSAWRDSVGQDWSDERLVATNALATCRRLTGDAQAAIVLGLEAFEARPDWGETALGLMQSYRALGQWEETVTWAERAAGCGVPHTDMVIEPLKLTVLPRLRAAEAYLELGKPDLACGAFKAAAEAAPQVESLETLRVEFEALVVSGDQGKALMCLQAAAAHYDTELLALVRGLRSEAEAQAGQNAAEADSSYRTSAQAKRPNSSRVSGSRS